MENIWTYRRMCFQQVCIFFFLTEVLLSFYLYLDNTALGRGGGVKKKNSTISIPPVHFCFIFLKKKSFIYFLILFIRRRNGKRKRIHAWSTYMQNLLWENGCHSISSMWSLSVLRAVCPSAEEVSNVSSANQRIDKGHIWNLKLP